MRTRLKLKPGQRGTKKLLAEYGPRLVCVRYRYDERRRRRFKTIELIVDEAAWQPKPKPETIVQLKVAWGEANVAREIKQAGGKWNASKKVWELRYDQTVKLGLQARIVDQGGI